MPWVGHLETPQLDGWCAERLPLCLAGMRRAISATQLTKKRPHFGQVITPIVGSVLAAADAAPDASPDYFFHWLRDSALVMDTLMRLSGETPRDRASYADFIRFSLGLDSLDGARQVRHRGFGMTDDPAYQVYVRSVLDLETIHGDGLRGEVRYNPDGTLDTLDWARPQFDGPALRALTLLRRPLPSPEPAPLHAVRDRLLGGDLDYVADHAGDLCYDLWEARFGHHYHTRLVSMAALREGAAWAHDKGDPSRALRYGAVARELLADCDTHWVADRRFYISTLDANDELNSVYEPDAAVLLAVLHARLEDGPHSVLDPRVQASMAVFEEMFNDWPVNLRLASHDARMIGRFRDDQYFGGGGFVMLTGAGMAELFYLLAQAVGRGRDLAVTRDNVAWLARVTRLVGHLHPGAILPGESLERKQLQQILRQRGDRYLRAIAALAPQDGTMPEQFDKETGAPASALDLTWSHASVAAAILTRMQA